jgi:hypothetical protein
MEYRVDALRWRVLDGVGVRLSFEDARAILRAARTLRRWFEGECGSGNSMIVRDSRGKPFREYSSPGLDGGRVRVPVRDSEAAAFRRLDSVCAQYGISYKANRDPRGCVLYLLPAGVDPDREFGVPVDL